MRYRTNGRETERLAEQLRDLKVLCTSWQFTGIETITPVIPRSQPPPPRAGNEPVGSPQTSVPHESRHHALAELSRTIAGCRRCRLSEGRTHIVFGDGNAEAALVFVGEGPGSEEDIQGLPFVGQAGKLLTKMIHSLGYRREEVYICNVVKCRPPKNRTPFADEVALCSPFLFQQLEIIRPSVICTLGSCATETLLQRKSPMNQLRGRVFTWRGIPVVPTFHPAYLLRSPLEKKKAWEDLLVLSDLLEQGSAR